MLLQAYHVDLSLFVFTHVKDIYRERHFYLRETETKLFLVMCNHTTEPSKILELVLVLLNIKVPEGSCSVNNQKFIGSCSRNSRQRWLVF